MTPESFDDLRELDELFADLAEPAPLDAAAVLAAGRRVRQRRLVLGGALAASTVVAGTLAVPRWAARHEVLPAEGPHETMLIGEPIADGERVRIGCAQFAHTTAQTWVVESSTVQADCGGEPWAHTSARGDFGATSLDEWVRRSHCAEALDLCTAVVPFVPADAWLRTDDGRAARVKAHQLTSHGNSTLITWAPVGAPATLFLQEANGVVHRVWLASVRTAEPLLPHEEAVLGRAYEDPIVGVVLDLGQDGWAVRTSGGVVGSLLLATGHGGDELDAQDQVRRGWATVFGPAQLPGALGRRAQAQASKAHQEAARKSGLASAASSSESGQASAQPPQPLPEPDPAEVFHVLVGTVEILSMRRADTAEEVIPTAVGLPGGLVYHYWRARPESSFEARVSLAGVESEVRIG